MQISSCEIQRTNKRKVRWLELRTRGSTILVLSWILWLPLFWLEPRLSTRHSLLCVFFSTELSYPISCECIISFYVEQQRNLFWMYPMWSATKKIHGCMKKMEIFPRYGWSCFWVVKYLPPVIGLTANWREQPRKYEKSSQKIDAEVHDF